VYVMSKVIFLSGFLFLSTVSTWAQLCPENQITYDADGNQICCQDDQGESVPCNVDGGAINGGVVVYPYVEGYYPAHHHHHHRRGPQQQRRASPQTQSQPSRNPAVQNHSGGRR